MALAAVQTAMNLEEQQSVHPFFSKPHKNPAADPKLSAVESVIENPHDDPDYEQPETGILKERKKRGRKPNLVKDKGKNGSGKGNQPSLDKFTRRSNVDSANENAPTTAQDVSAEPSLEEDPNLNRRKRRKTVSPRGAPNGAAWVDSAQPVRALNWHQQLEVEAGKGNPSHSEAISGISVDPRSVDLATHHPGTVTNDSKRPMTPLNDAADKPEIDTESEIDTSAPKTRITTPKKTLKINKNGKLLSPGSTKVATKVEPESTTPKKRTRRKPKPKVLPTITIIKYGADAESRRLIGERIDGILKRIKTAARPVTPKKAPPKPTAPPKATHPFFLGKTAMKKDESIADKTTSESQLPSPRAQKKSAVTPGKLRAESRKERSTTPMPGFGPVFGSTRVPKQAGLGESAWPTRETAHVRSLGSNILPPLQAATQTLLKDRKMKSHVLTIPKDEDIMARLACQLAPFIYRKDDRPTTDFEPPKDVRLPTRLLTTGVNIQEQVRSQVHATLPTSTISTGDLTATHPAIRTLFLDIEHSLTSFDLGKCESQSWVQKYAPKCASHVLQAGKEAATLHDWLTSLTVLAVGGKSDGPKIDNEIKKPPKKKRKKAMDDFILESDEEEEEEMVELENGLEYKNSSIGQTGRSSLRRRRWTRNKNVVLVSGPHGCGKSAMVYAVAKDLGFEVFEINSGSRRSGKDIQDKVGDMSENHLVNHKRNETSNKQGIVTPDDTDGERHITALQKDLESGRQGTMTSFFKGNGAVRAKPKMKTKSLELHKAPTSAQATLPIAQPQRKSQKQSLILFEEADILFEEDQQFWAYVTRLAAQSKRPIVVTCNDETRVPTHELPLAAILRLLPPPINLATDYLLILAGREGHVLDRDAVSALYKSKNHDLRASITELNLWCQMSVGDRKGGLEWMYQRWPPGKDVDEHGRILRIASQGTYQPGMGYLSHNMFASSNNIAFDKQEELLKETWVDWGINPCCWTSRDEEPETATLADLERLDALSESISAADIYSQIDMPSYERHHEQPVDPSLPPLPDKDRLNYTNAAPVIQVDHVLDFSQFDTDIFTRSHICIQRAYGGRHGPNAEEQHIMPTTEAGFTRAIIQYKQETQIKNTIARPDFSEAFDLLAYPPDTIPAMNTSYNLTASTFDRTFRVVVEDVAPYVRSIVAHELILESQRIRLGSLLSEGGSRTKRQRTTRAARTALEGGNRQTKRRERWFDKDLNRALVMGTAGKEWTGMDSGAGTGADDTEGSEKTGESV